MPDAVQLDHVSKRFVLRHERARTFQEAALALFRPRRNSREEFWALRDVTFTLGKGRTLGIVGRNGSGKSTLLKLLSRTLQPTSGTVRVEGRVFGLLELGAGFHPDLSGRDNIFLNGSFLGLSRREMARRFAEIVRFAELERFIDTPVKHYSSGMYMRLGFAIAISLSPDVLVVDEVLAVGDASFRQKCYAALAELKRQGKTILFVSHDTGAVIRFCDEALWLDAGQVRLTGRPEEVVREYLQETQARERPTGAPIAGAGAAPDATGTTLRWGAGAARLESVQLLDAAGTPRSHFAAGEPAVVRLELRCRERVPDLAAGIALHRGDGLLAFSVTTPAGQALEPEADTTTLDCVIQALHLGLGNYTVSAGLWRGDRWQAPDDMWLHAAALYLEACPTQGAIALDVAWRAAGCGLEGWKVGRLEGSGVRALERWKGAAGREAGEPSPAAVRQPSNLPTFQLSNFPTFQPSSLRVCWSPPPSRLAMGEHEDEFLGDGWYVVENWPPRVRWTGRRATLYLRHPPDAGLLTVAMCRPFHDGRVASGRVLLDGRPLGSFQLAVPQFQEVTFPVAPPDWERTVEVTIEVDEPIAPAEMGLSEDPRLLGVAVREIWLE